MQVCFSSLWSLVALYSNIEVNTSTLSIGIYWSCHLYFYQQIIIQNLPFNLRADGGTRRGNMGHLTRIANMVVQNLEKGPVQSQITDLIKGDASILHQNT